jgi:hypothetical protein
VAAVRKVSRRKARIPHGNDDRHSRHNRSRRQCRDDARPYFALGATGLRCLERIDSYHRRFIRFKQEPLIMISSLKLIALSFVAAIAFTFSGCQPPAAKAPAKNAEHDHAHDHVHNGPHGGHIMAIGNEEYHAEWTHDESGKITFYILDAAVKKEVPIAAEEITIDVKIGENEPVTYKLAAVNPQDGKSATFETVNQELLGILETIKKNKGTVCTLHVTIDGKHFSQKIEEHDHHDH